MWRGQRAGLCQAILPLASVQSAGGRYDFFFNLAGGSAGFHTLRRLWEPDSPSPSTASSCQDCLGILDKSRTRFLLMPLWRVTCSGVESMSDASSKSVSSPMFRFQATGRDKNVTMLKQRDHFLSLSPYSVSWLPLLPVFYGVWVKWVIFFFVPCLPVCSPKNQAWDDAEGL